MKLCKLVYLASPYTHKNPAIKSLRCKQADKAIGVLEDKFDDYAFIGPITQSARTVKYRKIKDTTFKNYQKRDLTYISRCDAIWVLMLDGWDQSVGVKAEIKFAKKLRIQVLYINPHTYSLSLTPEEDLVWLG